MFTETPRFMRAVELLNGIEDKTCQKIGSRIIGNVTTSTNALSIEETTQLSNLLRITDAEVASLIDSIKFIFQQAAFYSSKPSALKSSLEELNLDETKSEIISTIWMNHGKHTVEKLKEMLISDKQLDSVEWNVNISLANQHNAQEKRLTSLIHLNLLNNESEKTEKVILKMSHQELMQFYEKVLIRLWCFKIATNYSLS